MSEDTGIEAQSAATDIIGGMTVTVAGLKHAMDTYGGSSAPGLTLFSSDTMSVSGTSIASTDENICKMYSVMSVSNNAGRYIYFVTVKDKFGTVTVIPMTSNSPISLDSSTILMAMPLGSTGNMTNVLFELSGDNVANITELTFTMICPSNLLS